MIPESLRDQIGIEVGDVLEAKVERGKITFIPKSIVDRIPQGVKDVRAASKRKGLNKISREEIDAEVAISRNEKKQITASRKST